MNFTEVLFPCAAYTTINEKVCCQNIFLFLVLLVNTPLADQVHTAQFPSALLVLAQAAASVFGGKLFFFIPAPYTDHTALVALCYMKQQNLVLLMRHQLKHSHIKKINYNKEKTPLKTPLPTRTTSSSKSLTCLPGTAQQASSAIQLLPTL